MRAAPAFRLTLRRFGVWRSAVWALTGLAWTSTGAWLLASGGPGGAARLGLAALAVLAAWGWGRSLARQLPARLRWDGQLWWLARQAAPEQSGRIAVMLDLGAWMLLRFRPTHDGGPRPRDQWLPAQRRGHEAEWHALRGTVYSLPPAMSARASPDLAEPKGN